MRGWRDAFFPFVASKQNFSISKFANFSEPKCLCSIAMEKIDSSSSEKLPEIKITKNIEIYRSQWWWPYKRRLISVSSCFGRYFARMSSIVFVVSGRFFCGIFNSIRFTLQQMDKYVQFPSNGMKVHWIFNSGENYFSKVQFYGYSEICFFLWQEDVFFSFQKMTKFEWILSHPLSYRMHLLSIYLFWLFWIEKNVQRENIGHNRLYGMLWCSERVYVQHIGECHAKT